MSSAADLEALARKIRYDLTAAQGKLSELMRGIGDLASQLPEQGEKLSCPHCRPGGPYFSASPSGAERLADHLANVHGAKDTAPERPASTPLQPPRSR